MRCDAIILARGGSVGIPGKNIMDFCGKPLLAWTIEQAQVAKGVHKVWVSSDSREILDVAQGFGSNIICRPDELSGSHATGESAWNHALDVIEQDGEKIDVALALQVTSPLREPKDIEAGLKMFETGNWDSIFSCSISEDLYFWERDSSGNLKSMNYDYTNRQRRQDIATQYVENGSFYLFRPDVLRQHNNRLGGRIGCVEMEFWKMFEIDEMSDVSMCSALMEKFLL